MSLILCAVDFSASSPLVLETARQLARPGDEIQLLHVAPPEPDFVPYSAGPHSVRKMVAQELRAEHQQLLAWVEALNQEGWATHGHMVQGPTVETILAEAARRHASLLVVGAHGHGRLHEMLIGSTTTALLRQSQIPVVVVPRSSSSA